MVEKLAWTRKCMDAKMPHIKKYMSLKNLKGSLVQICKSANIFVVI